MIHSISDTTSPTPISPFSSNSLRSDPTSDELPDLGAFTTVFRALTNLHSISIPSPLSAPSELESDVPDRSTVWAHRPIANYLTHSNDSFPLTPSDDNDNDNDNDISLSGSDTEAEPEGRTVEIEDISDIDDADQPSLGYLDEALSFIAAERAKFTAQREAGSKLTPPSTAENAWRHVIEPRRKRRRKRKPFAIDHRAALPSDPATATTAITTATTDTTTAAEADQDDADDDSSSSFDHNPSYYKSTPTTPARTKGEKKKQRSQVIDANPKLSHSKSTPSLRLSLDSNAPPPDPRVVQLRSLAHNLSTLFPEDATALSSILPNDFPDSNDFVDPRGPVPTSEDTLIHVFIDHSNILIGLLSYLKRYKHPLRKPKRLSHAALALILERGRPITRRVLVTSSPLYQPMDSAEQLGYEVRVYARVPDTGDGKDRRHTNGGGSGSGDLGKPQRRATNAYSNSKSHNRRISGSTSTESELSASAAGFPKAFARASVRPVSNTTTNHTTDINNSNNDSNNNINNNINNINSNNVIANGQPTPPAAPSSATTRVRYREQGVDELLQLKLHQAIADVDVPPPNATIVLATGDGNVGQFNEDGFLGPVRTALKKGWRVELYAWEEGLSKAWMREFGNGGNDGGGGGDNGNAFGDRFRVIGMEQFGKDMLEV